MENGECRVGKLVSLSKIHVPLTIKPKIKCLLY